jgi:mRNA interferase MazF
VKRAEVRWYTFEPPDKRRPVLILTRNSAFRFLNAVTIAPITSTVRDIPSEVVLDQEDGLPTVCAVNLDHIQIVPLNRVGSLVTSLSATRMLQVQRAIAFALAFDEFTAVDS